MKSCAFTLAELAKLLNAEVSGDSAKIITGLCTLDSAKDSDLSFFDNPKYRTSLRETKAGAVIISRENISDCPVDALISPNPYSDYATVASLFADVPAVTGGVHPSVVVADGAEIADSAAIGPFCSIGEGTIIGENVQIGANCHIGPDCKIDEGTRLWPSVTLYYRVSVGSNCVLHSGVVIGSDGFGMAKEGGVWRKIAQLGGVTIGNEVEIGASTTIDRGALEDTVIADGVKLDNQIQIAHNVNIGAHTAVAGCAGISGSTKIGEHCMIGGGACVSGHVELGDNVMITGMSMVTKSVHKAGVYSSGLGGLQTNRDWRRNIVRIRQLDKLAKKVKMLEAQLANSGADNE